MSSEKISRNKDIYYAITDHKKSYHEVAEQYHISETRVRQIVTQVRRQFRIENRPTNQHIQALEEACKIFNATPTTRGRIYNALAAYGYLKRNRWRHLTSQDIKKMRNIGRLGTEIILKAQNL